MRESGEVVQWPTTYLQRLGRVFAEAYRVSRPNAILAVNVGSRRVAGVYYPLAFHLVPLLEEVGWKPQLTKRMVEIPSQAESPRERSGYIHGYSPLGIEFSGRNRPLAYSATEWGRVLS